MAGNSAQTTVHVHPLARVALETTLLLHGVPRNEALPLAARLNQAVTAQGASPLTTGVIAGVPIVGLNDDHLRELLAAPPESVRKLNTSNLGIAIARKQHGATTVSTTMELAAAAGVSVFATGGIGGVHFAEGEGSKHGALDVSADLYALTRFPVAVVASGVKSILDVAGTREMLETLGVPVVGFRTDDFPAFYLRKADNATVAPLDARFDDVAELAAYVRHELARSRRGILICNPIPRQHELKPADWQRWLNESRQLVGASGATGRDVTPRLLGALHSVSGGATLRANIALVESNAALAGQLARAMVA
ncbi:MAG: pseudouridine-5'-phosphate glycosidase [Phycisphaeraceae bacterium]|nr:pseudouridine-5'-phosphate glycosidase [Phycisphaeraceae bacterium]